MRRDRRPWLERVQARHESRLQPAAPRTRTRALLIGLLMGVAGTAVAFAVVALLIVSGASLIVALFTGFSGSALLPLAGVALGLIALGVLAVLSIDWMLRHTEHLRRDRWAKASMAVGALLVAALALVLMPENTRHEILATVTAHRYRPPPPSLPATEAEQRHLREVLRPAAEAGDARAQFRLGIALRYGQGGEKVNHKEEARWIRSAMDRPDGVEARLLVAVERMAPPDMARNTSADDKQAKVQALLDLPEARSPAWRPLVLGAIANLQQYTVTGLTPRDASMRDTWAEAGRAGSRAAAVLAAGLYEQLALKPGRNASEDEIAANWRRAMDGYARAGSLYDLRRVQREELEPQPRAAPAAQATPWHAPDTARSQRLQELAETLGGDALPENRIPSGDFDLAAAAALLATELAPDPAALPSVRAARRGIQQRIPALQRWLLALRHARGDCPAALELSRQLKNREHPGGDTPVTTLRTAWAVAWAESAQRCAGSDEQRVEVAQQLRTLALFISTDHTTDQEIEAARADVAALLADLR
jgi:hypothetical protein